MGNLVDMEAGRTWNRRGGTAQKMIHDEVNMEWFSTFQMTEGPTVARNAAGAPGKIGIAGRANDHDRRFALIVTEDITQKGTVIGDEAEVESAIGGEPAVFVPIWCT